MSNDTTTPLAEIHNAIKHALRKKRTHRRKRSKRSALKEMRDLDVSNWPMHAQMLRAWLVSVLEGRAGLDSARKYASAIGEPFLCWADGCDLKAMDGDEMIELYEWILLKTTVPSRRNWKAGRLDQFHRFGVQHFGLSPLPHNLTTGEGTALVNAKMIPEPAFLGLRERLCGTLGQDLDHKEALWVYLTLTYRCGFRRAELIKLLRRDIDIGPEIWIRCRGNSYGSTKSRSFKVPVLSLVLPSEGERVRTFLVANKPTEENDNELVFHETGLFGHVWNADAISREASKILNEVCADQGLVLHSGRHTATSRLFLAAFGTSQRVAELTPYSPDHCTAFRGAIFKDTEFGKDDAWCLSALLGHGSPAVTMQHYVHTAHLALHDQIEQNEALWSRNLIRNLSGATHRTVNRWLNDLEQADARVPVSCLADPTLGELANFAEIIDDTGIDVVAPNVDVAVPVMATTGLSINRVIKLCKDLYNPKKHGIDHIARVTGVPQQVLCDLADRIELINSVQTQRPRTQLDSDGSPVLMLRHVSASRVDRGMLSQLPRRPKHAQDHVLIPKLFATLEDVCKSDRDLFVEICQQFLLRMTASSSGMPLDSIDQLRRLFPTLSARVAAKHWQVIVRPPVGSDIEKIEKKWAVDTGLSIQIGDRTVSGRYKYPHGKAELRLRSAVEADIVNGQSIVNSFNKDNEARSAGKYSSSALKFVIFFAIVAWLETWELRELLGLAPLENEQVQLL